MNKMFKFLMMGAIICSAVACSNEDDKPAALIPAFVSVDATEISHLLLGDAGSKEVTLKANREVAVTLAPADASSWLTVDVSDLDATTSSVTLTLTVTKNEAEFKGRSATLNIAAIAARDDDDVSAASAKSSIEVKQSLFGLPIADLFDWKADAAGNVSDVSANALPITVGPAKPVVTLNQAYGLYEATISEISSEAYPADHALFPGNTDYVAIASEKAVMGDGLEHEVGSSRMCFYKIPWSTNTGIVNAYQNAFSYEVIYSAPEYTANMNNNIFGNINPTHCGFGIRRADNKNMFTYHHTFGATSNVSQKDDEGKDVTVEFDKYYHIVATYDKSSPTELIALYVDGVKVGSSSPADGSKDDLGKGLHFPHDYYGMATGHEHIEADRTAYTEYLCIGAGVHQGGYGRFGAPHNTKIVVARVYGHALNQTEVSALYNYHKPE